MPFIIFTILLNIFANSNTIIHQHCNETISHFRIWVDYRLSWPMFQFLFNVAVINIDFHKAVTAFFPYIQWTENCFFLNSVSSILYLCECFVFLEKKKINQKENEIFLSQTHYVSLEFSTKNKQTTNKYEMVTEREREKMSTKKELNPHGFSHINEAFISIGLPSFLTEFQVMIRISECTCSTFVFYIKYWIDRFTFELVQPTQYWMLQQQHQQ